MQKAVLRAVDDHEGGRGCFASQATIATEIGCSEVTVNRAVAALIDQDLMTKERPNHWSPNHHRINWTALAMIANRQSNGSAPVAAPSSDRSEVVDESCHHGDVSTHQRDVSCHNGDASDTSQRQVRSVMVTGPSRHSDVRIANSNDQSTDHLTAKWAAMAATMRNWGLSSAVQSCKAARDRGLSIEYVAELFRESGGHREPERWEPGQLANWLTGRTPEPFDEAEAIRRREARDRDKMTEVERIRESVRRDGESRGVPEWAIAGVAFKRMTEAGLERFATEDERVGSDRLTDHERLQLSGCSREIRTELLPLGNQGSIDSQLEDSLTGGREVRCS